MLMGSKVAAPGQGLLKGGLEALVEAIELGVRLQRRINQSVAAAGGGCEKL